MKDLTTMLNIGQEMASKLKSVEINTAEQLVKIGSKEAFFRLKMKFPKVCLVHLYALEGAIQNIEFNCLPKTTKADLTEFSDSLK